MASHVAGMTGMHQHAPPHLAYWLKWELNSITFLPEAGLEPWSFGSPPPKYLGFQVWATTPDHVEIPYGTFSGRADTHQLTLWALQKERYLVLP
jgi:hypothetical protein